MWNFVVVLMNTVGGLLLGAAVADWWMAIYEAGFISEPVEIVGIVSLIITIAVQIIYVADEFVTGKD